VDSLFVASPGICRIRYLNNQLLLDFSVRYRGPPRESRLGPGRAATERFSAQLQLRAGLVRSSGRVGARPLSGPEE